MTVCVVTMYSPEYREIAEITIPVMKEYAQKHGYLFSEIKLPDGKYEYKKIEAIKEILRTVDVVFYLDSDALITNYNVKVEDFLDEHYLYVCKDVTEINFGVAIFVADSWTEYFLDYILSEKENYPNEQNVLNAAYEENSFAIKIVDHPSLNSYDYSLYPELPNVRDSWQGHWREGDFILHVPGAAYETRINRLKTAKITK